MEGTMSLGSTTTEGKEPTRLGAVRRRTGSGMEGIEVVEREET